MSGYSRNYVGTWNKPGSYSGTSRKEMPSTIPKYDLGYSKTATTKSDSDKNPKITTTKYGSYGSSYQPTSTSTGSYSNSRLKPVLDKPHPPVSYKPLTTRTTTSKSRDPSPIERSEKSSSSSSGIYNPSRLYPRPYTRSNSRERTVSPTPSTSNLPRYTGRSSIGSDRSYGGRSSTTKDDIPRYTGRSSSSLSKDDGSSKYKTSSGSRTASKEDLSGSQKYINSRFLPKNSVEKSYTAYTRPSLVRTNETSRKNKELLTILHAQQEQEKMSRPTSRCSSVSPDDAVVKTPKKRTSPEKKVEMETVTVITRGTSPSPTSQPTSFLRSRRITVAKVVERQITRPKRRDEIMVDKEVQSDRLDDSTRLSRFSGASRISATPWSSFLDMKFNSPNTKQQKNSSQENPEEKPLSRTSSSKSIGSNKSDKSKKSPKPSKISQPKQLPPQIPKSDSKTGTLHSLNTPNKDFRKSVLNMNPDGTKKKIGGRRSTSGSSAESDAADADATDVSENLTSCKSFHKTNSSSKLPQKISPQRNTRSPSSDVSVSSSASSEDDVKTKKQSLKSAGSSRTSMVLSSADELSTDKSPRPPQSPRPKTDSSKSEQEAKSFLMRALAPVTNLFKNKQGPPSPENSNKVTWILNSSDSPSEITPNSPQIASEPRQAKIILRRVESGEKPVISNHMDSGDIPWWLQKNPEVPEGVQSYPEETNQEDKTKIRPVQSGEVAWWLQANPDVPEGVKTYPGWMPEKEQTNKLKIKHVESGEQPWWLQTNAEVPEGVKTYPGWVPEEEKTTTIKPVESGEGPWWLDENAEVPEGVETYPNWVRDDGTTQDGRVIYKIRRNESDDSSWWNTSSSEKTDSKNLKTNIMDQEYQDRHKLRHIDSGDRSWWTGSQENIPGMVEAQEVKENTPRYAVRHQDSGIKPWWIGQDDKHPDDHSDGEEVPLGDRASPEGLEMPKDDESRPLSPYDNVPSRIKPKRPNSLNFYISRHKNIDEILGGTAIWSPLMERLIAYGGMEGYTQVDPNDVIIHEGDKKNQGMSSKLDDAALQLYKDGDYGSYLDLEASISEQQEEFEGFQSNKKNSIVLRTQLSVRVHTIIEKLLSSEGRELRRALFSLKQIFQEDKDLVHEFVQNDGLSCLIKVGSEADQNYQNYILRALGQVMLYVDGMNGVMDHNQTIQWLYTLISSKFRLVVKTALKLLLVFVEYTDSNCMLLIKAIHSVDYSQGLPPYHNIMKLLKDFDAADTELLIYATTLINKVLSGVPDQDTYYDQVDVLEEQGMEAVIQRYMSKPGTDLDLLQQFQIYEAVLQYEDGEDLNNPIRHLDESMRKTLRNRKSLNDSSDRRKSRRHSTGTAPHYVTNGRILPTNLEDFNESSSSQNSGVCNSQLNGSYKDSNKAGEAGVTPALKRRRERAERQRSFMKEQQESAALLKAAALQSKNEENLENSNGNYTNGIQQRMSNGGIPNRNSSRKDLTSLMNTVNTLNSEENLKQPWIYSQNIEESENNNENERNLLMQLKRENTVKDLTQKLSNQNMLHSPSEENKINRIGDMSGLISKAKEGLAKSKSRAEIKSPIGEAVQKVEVKKSENELRWEELVANLNRTLNLCDMDFTDLGSDDEQDVLAPAAVANGIPPPPPPLLQAPPPPPIGARVPPPVPPTAPLFGISLQRASKQAETKIPIKKNKKTVKLFWKEVRDEPISLSKLKAGSIWDELTAVSVDTQKLEHLFESRAKDLITKKQQEMNKNKEIIVLDPKRSNAINIGMTKLPPPRSIKTAILKMDATVMNREGIEKLLTMLPTEEERTKIQEAQAANPDLPLGSAEQFLLTLASISELPARLKLWAFKLDFENSEREIAEPLMDLKQGFEVLKVNKTFRGILSTLLSIGNFLNGNEVKGFQIEYLAKVPEVKDTVHKHSLLHHLCHIVMEKFPEATDLYSEIGAITRASKIDFDELSLNIQRLESDCKASWDHLKLIAKHDGSTMMKVKMSDFLADCAERIILLEIIHRRIMNRFHKFLLWLGIPLHQISDTKPNEFCRIVSEFALEYRTTRERVIQQLEKKANHRERNKTRGKMITDMGKFKSKEDRADAELRQLLGSDMSDVESLQGTLPWRRTRKDGQRGSIFAGNGNLTDGDDEILESLVKTATKGVNSRTAPRERKRTRHADRKSLRRTLKNGLSEEEKKHLSAYIKGY